jgi:hypothetical protein
MFKLFRYVTGTTIVFYIGIVWGLNLLNDAHMSKLFGMIFAAFMLVKFIQAVKDSILPDTYPEKYVNIIKSTGILFGILIVMLGYMALFMFLPKYVHEPVGRERACYGLACILCVIGLMVGGIRLLVELSRKSSSNLKT